MVDMGQAIHEVRYRNLLHPRLGLEVLTLQTLADRATPAHLSRTQRLDFHMLMLIWGGGGSHMVDFVDHRLGTGSVVHVRPGQVHRFGDRSQIDGRLVLFTPAFAPADGPIDPFGPALLVPSARDLEVILRIVDEISEESAAPDLDEDSISVMRSSLMVVLARLARSRPGGTLSDARPSDRFRRFRQAVEDSFVRRHTVAAYARSLGCSARTLERACLGATGRTAKEQISARVVLEAKRLLAYTDLSAASIGTRLGFTEATNFVKFFRRESGVTPGAFRRDR
ncbi:MAG: AraC family transcriptional regulator [Actinobacteria bacterium]|nr:AraC family transcriptional regulator [Actinomycetota bacterium]